MTKAEKKIVNTFFVNVLRSKKKKLINAQLFSKKYKKGKHIVAIPLTVVTEEWVKLRKKVEGK